MTDMYERDPEEVGPEHPDDLNARMNFIEARHEFLGGKDGKCDVITRSHYPYRCGNPSWSVLHIDDKLDNHDHGGGDCMCFEGVVDCE
jgi:hypothetical protein